jgi:hypothetical protein
MISRIFRRRNCCLATAVWLAIALQFVQAADVKHLSGSYQVAQKTDRGAQSSVRLVFRLTNQGEGDLSIQRIALWDFSHPGREAMRPCTLVIPRGSSTETTQEFTVPRSELESWRGANGLRLLLEVRLPSGRMTTEVVHLNAAPGRKAN